MSLLKFPNGPFIWSTADGLAQLSFIGCPFMLYLYFMCTKYQVRPCYTKLTKQKHLWFEVHRKLFTRTSSGLKIHAQCLNVHIKFKVSVKCSGSLTIITTIKKLKTIIAHLFIWVDKRAQVIRNHLLFTVRVIRNHLLSILRVIRNHLFS